MKAERFDLAAYKRFKEISNQPRDLTATEIAFFDDNLSITIPLTCSAVPQSISVGDQTSRKIIIINCELFKLNFIGFPLGNNWYFGISFPNQKAGKMSLNQLTHVCLILSNFEHSSRPN